MRTWPCRRALDTHACLAGRNTKGRPCPGLVTTPISGRDPKEARPCRDTTSAHSGAFRSRRQKLRRDTPVAPLYRNAKDCDAIDLSSHAVFVLRRQRPCRDTPMAVSVVTSKSCHDPGPAESQPSYVATQKLMS